MRRVGEGAGVMVGWGAFIVKCGEEDEKTWGWICRTRGVGGCGVGSAARRASRYPGMDCGLDAGLPSSRSEV